MDSEAPSFYNHGPLIQQLFIWALPACVDKLMLQIVPNLSKFLAFWVLVAGTVSSQGTEAQKSTHVAEVAVPCHTECAKQLECCLDHSGLSP